MKQLSSLFIGRMGRVVLAACALAALVGADPVVSAEELLEPSVCESCHPGMPNYATMNATLGIQPSMRTTGSTSGPRVSTGVKILISDMEPL